MKDWQPSASIRNLKKRAALISNIRQFFVNRDYLEVETPLLSHSTVTNPYIESIEASVQNKTLYLQTSPEFAMKRLLAAGSGPIFQISKAFRKEESGKKHNPEFTILEWYRPGFDHHQLMEEMDLFLQSILKCKAAEKITYQNLFKHYLKIDPLTATEKELKQCAKQNNIVIDAPLEKDDWLNLLMASSIEPVCSKEKPIFVYDYPASQSALAKISKHDARTAARFEVFYKGIELANGFHELSDAKEQRQRFEDNNKKRFEMGLNPPPLDELFLQALGAGLPDCAGVAVGVDRLAMLGLDLREIQSVLSFEFSRA
jgi:elongation factor P--(R)-beta-lysine ligase